jgi:type II secretory pathway pseudopilin PulG
MPDDSQVCPKCAAPVQPATPSPQAQQPGSPAQATPTSGWLDVPSAPQQNFQQPQYSPQGQPYGGQYPQKTDGGAIASLVLGIASFALCLTIFTGIPAIILGHISRSKISKSSGRLKGDGLALAGLIMGYCSLPFILISAAVVLPNLLRARISANEAAAASTVRMVNTAQLTYMTTYLTRGYAPDLATLGTCNGSGTADHACLIDSTLGGAHCTSGTWCQKGGYRFTIVSNCNASTPSGQGEDASCKEYVVVATPVNPGAGLHNYCAISDAVVRVRTGRPLLRAPTAEECGEWPPLS